MIPAKVKGDWEREFRLMASIKGDDDVNFWQIKRAEALYSSLYQNMPEKMTHILTFANTLMAMTVGKNCGSFAIM